MNISATNVNFNGRKEVVYGLRKAAQEAYNIEINRSHAFGPHPMHLEHLINKSEGKMNAYLDMAANDESFAKTIGDLASEKLTAGFFKDVLQPTSVPFGKINPLKVFSEGIQEAVSKKTEQCKAGVQNFINAIKM